MRVLLILIFSLSALLNGCFIKSQLLQSPEQQAIVKTRLEQYLKGISRGNYQAVLAVVDFPFLVDGPVIENAEQLKQNMIQPHPNAELLILESFKVDTVVSLKEEHPDYVQYFEHFKLNEPSVYIIYAQVRESGKLEPGLYVVKFDNIKGWRIRGMLPEPH